MPTAEVVIEEGDFLSPTPSLAGELSSSECVSLKEQRRKRFRGSTENSLEIFPSSDGAKDDADRPRKRLVAFRTTEGNGIDIECQAEDLSTSPGASRKETAADEITISAIGNSLPQSTTPTMGSESGFSSSYLPIMAPQFDFSTKFAGLPLNFSSARSGSSTPRPGPSSGLGSDDPEDVGGEQGGRASFAGLSLSSISLIESHVGVGFTLGSREKPYKCEQCGQCYKYLSAFTKHKEQNHTARLPGEKPFRCEVCGMQFKYLKSFKKHRLNHAVERLHPVYPRPLGSLVEERSVLEMIARPLAERRGGGDSSEGASPDVRRSNSVNEEADAPPVINIKTETDAASSAGDSDDGGKARSDSPADEGSQQQAQNEPVQPQVNAAALQRQIATCPNCHQKFVNEESLKLHSVNCPESLTAPGTSVAISPSLLHEALRHQQQQRAAILAALSQNPLVLPPAPRRIEQENASSVGPPPAANDESRDASDKDAAEGDSESQASFKSSTHQPKAAFPSPGAGSFRPPALHSTPPPFMHGVYRELSAVNPMAAANALASVAAFSVAAPLTPVPPQDYDPGRPHLCPFCGKGFRAKENLKLHIRKHTGERPFECEFCGRAFGGKSDMNRHLRIHTGERPYRCDACGKTFARADYLSKHLSTHLV